MEIKYDINQVIRARRSVFPQLFDTTKTISKDIILQLLYNANCAPTHKKTEPWRFTIIQGSGLQRLSEWLAEDYKAHAGDKFSEIKRKKTTKKPLQCAAVIAIVMERHEDSGLPEWEEIAAVACAVQNLWLSATAFGLGGYWSTPGAKDRFGEFIPLDENQRCLGFFYLGVPREGLTLESPRGAIEDKINWVE